MWGNLAGRIAKTDLNAALEKIGNAVAPRDGHEYNVEEDDGEDYEEYDDDDQEYEDDDQEYEDDDDGEEEAGATFGLVGFLARTLHNDNNNTVEVETDEDRFTSTVRESQLLNEKSSQPPLPQSTTATTTTRFAQQQQQRNSEPITTSMKPSTEVTMSSMSPALEKELPTTTNSLNPPIVLPTKLTTSKIDRTTDRDSNYGRNLQPRQTDQIPSSSNIGSGRSNVGRVPESYDDIVSKYRSGDTTSTMIPTENYFQQVADHSLEQKVDIDMNKRAVQQPPVRMKEPPMKEVPITPPQPAKATISSTSSPSRRTTVQQPAVVVDKRQYDVIPVPKMAPRYRNIPEVPTETKRLDQHNIRPQTAHEKPSTTESAKDSPVGTNLSAVGADSATNSTYKRLPVPRMQPTTSETTKNDGRMERKYNDVPKDNSMMISNRQSKEPLDERLTASAQPSTASDDPSTDRMGSVVDSKRADDPIHQQSNVAVGVNNDDSETKKLLQDAESMCQDLQKRLLQAEQAVETIRQQAQQQQAHAEMEREALMIQFQQKEERLLQATTEENQNVTIQIEQQYQSKVQMLEQTLMKERAEMKDEAEEYKKLVRESDGRVDRAEKQLKAATKKYENDTLQAKQREERAVRKVEDRLAQTMAMLDERNDEVAQMKKLIRTMESKVNEHQEGAEEAEEEVEELHQENASLQRKIESLEAECKRLKQQVGTLEGSSDKLAGMQLELTMLREELVRERTKSQSAVDSAITSHTRTESERDAALSELRDMQQQLDAAMADLEVARADSARIMLANSNLQGALEAFQDERQAEMRMIYEQRQEWEDAIKSAHSTAMNALRQTHESEMYEVQKAGDMAVKNAMDEMEMLHGIIEKLKSENFQLRRSLDEAIHRLHATQEDVVDRDVMKNILLDWCTLKEKNKRHQVLQVMANLLHFSEEEKDRVNLTGLDFDSVGAKVVGALAAPLPPSKADVDHLEGDNVREKWINFLMAETDDT